MAFIRPARAAGWTPPFTLPSSGQVVAVGATNTPQDLTFPNLSGTDVNRSAFRSFGDGPYVADYSAGGAYVNVCSGGHLHPDMVDALIFDFTDRTWRRLANSNGAANKAAGYDRVDCNSTDWTITGFSDQVPCPSHPYTNYLPLSTAAGGGSKGSVLIVCRTAATTDPVGNFKAFRFDLATGAYSAYSSNRLSDVQTDTSFTAESPSALHVATGRFYTAPVGIHNVINLPYVLASDSAWHNTTLGSFATDLGGGLAMFVDETRGLLIIQNGGSTLRAIDLNNISGGVTTLSVTGTLPSSDTVFQYCPTDGNFYTFIGTGQSIHKLVPPASSPLSNAWTVSTVSHTGASLPADDASLDTPTPEHHYKRFFWVSSISCFAWIAGGTNDVYLWRP